MIMAGEGKHRVWLRKQELDKGLVLMLGGGESSHVGGAAYVTPDGDEDIMEVKGHHDMKVLLPIARGACEKYGVPVMAVGGIHIENASKSDIELLVSNCMELLKCI
ncbi:MAG: hypothetical protein KKH41_04135 [Candidatus Thermoplasmatota archaeon]|nr:hypothetical protein [Euryarchaeota archaeon]MBU4031509.1 hypothetical protein [Candidatus Thermoplasmatota archaeon]MBU4070870.1 hypothetical protein [Candidatus Thermoplasmatota archaeon]MBU4143570.1 hypothetical protein [Candidatus Thermoplasmatota archaeon]MBU4591757.1 hypothetical protein [Candidatus Thermoplasmatota archaeon]